MVEWYQTETITILKSFVKIKKMGISQLFNTLGNETKNAIDLHIDPTLIMNVEWVKVILRVETVA